MEETSVVRVSIEVRHGAARFRVRVQASSIRKAAGLVKAFHSVDDARVVFPIDPEGFFVEDASRAGLIGSEPPEQRMAA